MKDTPQGSYRVLLDKKELEIIINSLEIFDDLTPGIEALKNDLRMVLAGTL